MGTIPVSAAVGAGNVATNEPKHSYIKTPRHESHGNLLGQQWITGAHYEQAGLNGVRFTEPKPHYWAEVIDADIDTPPWPNFNSKNTWIDPKGNSSPSIVQKGKSTGVIFVEPDGQFWIYEPTNHFGGYMNTFSKGGIEEGLTEQQNALKEASEELGLDGKITGYLGDFEGDTSVSRFFIGKRTGGAPWTAGWESHAVKLVSHDDASQLLNRSRDQYILKALASQNTTAGDSGW